MPLDIRIQRSDLYTALSPMVSITSRKSSLAILHNVVIETVEGGVRLTVSDLQVGLRSVTPAEVRSPGVITLPARKLFDIVRESDAEMISFDEKENRWIRIEAGTSTYNVAGMDPDEYPEFPDYDPEGGIALPADKLADCIAKVAISVIDEGETQYNVAGALLDIPEEKPTVLRLVSSDGHRLSFMEHDMGENLEGFRLPEQKVLLPKKGLQEMKKLCDQNETVVMAVEEKKAVLRTESTVLVVKLLTSDFPRYDKFVSFPRENPVVANRERLLNALRRINLFTDDEFHIVKFDISNNAIRMTSQNADIGSAKEDIDIQEGSHDLSIYFNGRYFVDCLSVLTGDQVQLYITDNESPCFVTCDAEPGFIGVIMPMRF